MVDDIFKGNHYDIIYLDIQMGFFNGLEVAKKIREKDKLVSIIFVTSYKTYALEAYEVHPFEFIVKPIQNDRFFQIFQAAYENIVSNEHYFRYKTHRESEKILINNILYFESEIRTIKIHTSNNIVTTFYGKINDLEKNLKSCKAEFWRIHQSYLINRKHIYKMSFSHVTMSDNIVLPISASRRKKIREKYLDFIGDNII